MQVSFFSIASSDNRQVWFKLFRSALCDTPVCIHCSPTSCVSVPGLEVCLYTASHLPFHGPEESCNAHAMPQSWFNTGWSQLQHPPHTDPRQQQQHYSLLVAIVQINDNSYVSTSPSSALQNVLNKTHARHQELIQAYQRDMFRVSADTPWWSAGLTVRTALQALADTLARYFLHLQSSFQYWQSPRAVPNALLSPIFASNNPPN